MYFYFLLANIIIFILKFPKNVLNNCHFPLFFEENLKQILTQIRKNKKSEKNKRLYLPKTYKLLNRNKINKLFIFM